MSESEEKTEKASARKLRKQREDGSVPSSQELSGLVGAAVGLLVLAGLAAVFLGRILDFYRFPFEMMQENFLDALDSAASTYSRLMTLILGPILGLSIFVSVIVAIIYNKGIVFAFKPVTPQIDRISPMTGLKRIYGKRGWVETGISSVRLVIWLTFASFCAYLIIPDLFSLFSCSIGCSTKVVEPLAWFYVLGAVMVFLLSAGADMIVQRSLFLSEQMMTKSEVKQERKEQGGTPEIRKERRRRASEDSKSADAIGPGRANMCFFSPEGAVTIRYHPEHAPLPRVTAKGTSSEKVRDLRENVRERGMPEMQHDFIVKTCLKKSPGDAIDSEIFEEFALALRALFSKR
ncbi:EscU/YscU/HrcU family type III secretion system export apparatus switch protein [Aestuariibius insulae]|uniref:EscU/YscU/HrcU family type III secretion system export apparatus switch protein n=1 Tax=Aestuariibius insulae TaxID=2058287 RepID=UPI00345E3986